MEKAEQVLNTLMREEVEIVSIPTDGNHDDKTPQKQSEKTKTVGKD